MSTTLLRGFKVSVATLDKFLAANHVDETHGTPPFYSAHPDQDPISRLLFSKITQYAPDTAAHEKTRYRVLILLAEGRPRSKIAYIPFIWAAVYTHRRIGLDKELGGEIPGGFLELREEILGHASKEVEDEEARIDGEGGMGVYMVVTYEIRGYYSEEMERAQGISTV